MPLGARSEEGPVSKKSRQTNRTGTKRMRDKDQFEDRVKGDSNSISKTAEGEDATTFRDAAVYLSIAVPSKEAFLRFARDPRLYVATQARRQRIEVS